MAAESADAIDLNITGAGLLDSFEWRDFSVTVPNTAGAGYSAIDGIAGARGTFKRLHLEGTYGVKGSGLTDCTFEACSAVPKGASGGLTGVGFLLGARCKAICCTVDGTTAATSYAEGFEFAIQQSSAESCSASNLVYGFMWASGLTVMAVAKGCRTVSCTTAYRPYGDVSVIEACYDSGSTTVVTNGASTAWLGKNSYFDNTEAFRYAYSEVATASPTFTFDPTKSVNIFVATYSGAAGTAAIALSGSPTLKPCTRYTIVMQAKSGTSLSGWSSSSDFVGGAGDPLASGHHMVADFMVSTDGSKIVQITGWKENTDSNPWEI
jgi:hypothetical protein